MCSWFMSLFTSACSWMARCCGLRREGADLKCSALESAQLTLALFGTLAALIGAPTSLLPPSSFLLFLMLLPSVLLPSSF